MRVFVVIAAFFVGFMLGFPLALGGYLVWVEWLGGSDREGSAGMAAFFFYGPILGLFSGLALSVAAWRLRR